MKILENYENNPITKEMTSENRIDLSPDNSEGVVKEILVPGHGDSKPAKGNTVFVHYTGTLEDGTKFDSSIDRGEQFQFTLGKGQVIKAWDLGVASMLKGEKCRLICKPDYAYGKAGSPPRIPADSTLIFEVELFSWEGEDISPDKDKSIIRSVQTEGEGFESPNDGATCKVVLIGRCEGKEFLRKDETEILLGESTEVGLPEGIDKVLKRMKKGERSVITMGPRYGFGKAGRAEYGVPGNATIEWDITLKEFIKVKDSWQMDDDEKLMTSEALKARGTAFFQEEKYKLALSKYRRIEDLLDQEKSFEGEKKTKRDSLLLAARLNSALCYLKKNDTVEATKQCDKVLEMEGHDANVKALYRRAQAYQSQSDWEEAIGDYQRILAAEPDNKAAKAQMAVCRQGLKKIHDKQNQIFQGMFDKFSAKDAKKAEVVSEEHRKRVFPDAEGDSTQATNGTEQMEEDDDDDAPPPPLENGSAATASA